jgi:hypothetical protein
MSAAKASVVPFPQRCNISHSVREHSERWASILCWPTARRACAERSRRTVALPATASPGGATVGVDYAPPAFVPGAKRIRMPTSTIRSASALAATAKMVKGMCQTM